ncbi:hypothetical protein HanRHA438_Chr08g0334741 [Helianthus annuus]|nr:hypothetical protein HanRHA438_Chr08g0334741 [Helianthus annuus]
MYPKMCLLTKTIMLTILVSTTARIMMALTATRAPLGFPAPSSFETLVLKKQTVP